MSSWYHGTNQSSAESICTNGVDFSKSNKELDFGVGFYLAEDDQVARKRAIQKTKMFNRINRCNEQPALVRVQIDDDYFDNLKVKEFPYCNNEWLHFIFANRLSKDYLKEHGIVEHNLDLRYDVVKGSIADSNIARIVNHIEIGNVDLCSISVYDVLTREGTTLGEQMSLHTVRSLELIKDVKYEIMERGNQ